MSDLTTPPGVGTLLRHALDLLDGDIARIYRDLGLPDYRPKFSPVVRALAAAGPMPIRDLAHRAGVTHSAASQTVAQMARAGLVTLEPGADARQRIVHLTPRAQSLLPTIEAEWAAATLAQDSLDAELPIPLADLLTQLISALERRPFHQRITAAGIPIPEPDVG